MSDIVGDRTGAERAPGDEDNGGGIRSYQIGYALSLTLTAASFAMVALPAVWPPAVPAALVALTLAQIGVHLVFFLHITSGPDNTNNAIALMFGAMVTLFLVCGSVWIMTHLDHRMMPMNEIMQHMR